MSEISEHIMHMRAAEKEIKRLELEVDRLTSILNGPNAFTNLNNMLDKARQEAAIGVLLEAKSFMGLHPRWKIAEEQIKNKFIQGA